MADTTAFPYERLPPDMRGEIILRLDASTLGSMRATSTLLRDDVDRAHPLFSSIQGHDLISGLASACELGAAPHTIVAIIRSLSPSHIIRGPHDQNVIVRTMWTLPQKLFDYCMKKTTPTGAMRCISILNRKLESYPSPSLIFPEQLSPGIGKWVSRYITVDDFDLALDGFGMLTKCIPHHLAAPLFRTALSRAADHDGGVERVVEFVVTRIDDFRAIVASYDSGASVADMLLLGGMIDGLLETTDSRDVKSWALSVMHSYYVHWFSRICAAVLARPGTSAERARDISSLSRHAVTIAGRLMETFDDFEHLDGVVKCLLELNQLVMPIRAVQLVVHPFHVPRFDPRWLHASQQ